MSDIEVLEIGVAHVVEFTYETPDPLAGAEIISVTAGELGVPLRPVVLDDLGDVVDPAQAATGVLTRDEPGAAARFAVLPAPVRPQRHVQLVPSLRWQVVHELGWRPAFTVRDEQGHLHMPENVEHPVPGVISEIVFGVPLSGTADPS